MGKLLLLFLFLLAVLGCPPPLPEPIPKTPEKKKFIDVAYPGDFPHGKHILNQTDKECGECHKEDGSGRINTDFLCTTCHRAERKIQFQISKISRPFRFASFPHNKHKKTKCLDCHGTKEKGVYRRTMDLESCAKCHNRHTSFEKTSQCNRCHTSPVVVKKNRQKFFSHLTHSKNCTTCHSAILETTQGFSAPSNWEGQCAKCHLKSQILSTSKPTQLGNFVFSHKSHLKKNKSCTPCHVLQKGKIVFPQGPISYQACLGCHPKWKVASHKVSKNCLGCHSPQENFRLPHIRKEVVQKQFSLIQNPDGFHKSHSFTGKCKKCHLKSLPSLPRARLKSFQHKSHLPAGVQPGSKICLTCHINRVAPSVIDGATCLKCHSQAPGEKILQSNIVDFPLFAHGQHQQINCGTCHNFQIKNKRFSLAKACGSCHHPRREKGAGLKTHQACLRCHRGYGFMRGKKEEVPRQSHLSLDQFATPHGRGKACRACHVEQDGMKEFSKVVKIIRRTGGLHSPLNCGTCHIRLRK